MPGALVNTPRECLEGQTSLASSALAFQPRPVPSRQSAGVVSVVAVISNYTNYPDRRSWDSSLRFDRPGGRRSLWVLLLQSSVRHPRGDAASCVSTNT